MLYCVVETEDDHVAEAVQRARRIKLDIELAQALTDETFTSTIKERNIVFTLFYLPCKQIKSYNRFELELTGHIHCHKRAGWL